MSNLLTGLKPDLVVSVAEISCLEAWKLTGPQLLALVPASEYWLIVPDDQLQQFVDNSPVEYTIFPESVFTQDFSEKFNRCDGAVMPGRKGWYLQQLIKLAALRKSSHLDRIVIWDADTIPLREISFFDTQGNCRYFFGSEYHLPYFKNIDRLMGLDKAHPDSFIAQNFPITGKQIESFFSFIEKRHSANWWDAVIDSIDFDEWSGFSEYETLGTFVSHFEHQPLTMQPGTWSRNGQQAWVSNKIRSGESRKTKHDFVAVETWARDKWVGGFLRRVLGVLGVYLLKARSFVASVVKFPSAAIQMDTRLAKIFESPDGIDVIQVGANDGIQNDPLRKFLRNPGSFSARLVEPIPFYSKRLRGLYLDRPDVEIIDCAAGSQESIIDIYHIAPAKAMKMNGDGPPNNWALQQGSSSRATVVYWIYKNSWRGGDYKRSIPEWIGAVEKLRVRVVPTRELIRSPHKTLLVIDVQGMETGVLLGLSKSNLPRWVVIDESLGYTSARKLLIGWGYREILSGGDSLFEYTQIN
jgi:hypothetical protein